MARRRRRIVSFIFLRAPTMTDTPDNLPDVPAKPSRTITAHFQINLALIVALAAFGLIATFWLTNRQNLDLMQLKVSEKLASAQTVADESRRHADRTAERIQETGNRVAILEDKLAEAQAQQAALTAMYQSVARHREDWLVAEAEQTLMLAQQQLQLAGNVPVALTALEGLDQRLSEIPGPKLVPLRRQLANDIATLKAQPYIDPLEPATVLDSLIQKVDRLPVNGDPSRQKPAAPAGKPEKRSALEKAGDSLWGSLKELVVIREISHKDAILTGPDQAFYARENVKLRLADARLALLQRHQSLYNEDITAARGMLTRHFDRQDKEVAAALVQLEQLSRIRLEATSVDLNASIALARDLLTRDQDETPPLAASAATAQAASAPVAKRAAP